MSYPHNSNDDGDNDHHYTTMVEDDDNDRCSSIHRKGSAAAPKEFNPTFYNPFEIKHRRRISREQFKKLEKAFNDNPKPNGKLRQKLAEHVSMTPRGVQVWFQNRRAKAKQQKENKKKQQQALMEKDQQFTVAVNVEPVLFSAHSMVHSRSQSSSLSSISYTDSAPSIMMMEDKYQSRLSYPSIIKPTWNSDASTVVTGVDEEDSNMLKSPFTPLQTQIPSNFHPSPDAAADFLWMENATTNSMMFQSPSSNLNDPFLSSINCPSLQTNAHVSQQGDHLLDAWAYLDDLNNASSTTQGKLVNSLVPNNKNDSRYLGNKLAYNRNVTDWIKTVSLAQYTERNLSGNFQTKEHKRSKELSHSFIPLFEQDATYWNGQKV